MIDREEIEEKADKLGIGKEEYIANCIAYEISKDLFMVNPEDKSEDRLEDRGSSRKLNSFIE